MSMNIPIQQIALINWSHKQLLHFFLWQHMLMMLLNNHESIGPANHASLTLEEMVKTLDHLSSVCPNWMSTGLSMIEVDTPRYWSASHWLWCSCWSCWCVWWLLGYVVWVSHKKQNAKTFKCFLQYRHSWSLVYIVGIYGIMDSQVILHWKNLLSWILPKTLFQLFVSLLHMASPTHSSMSAHPPHHVSPSIQIKCRESKWWQHLPQPQQTIHHKERYPFLLPAFTFIFIWVSCTQ